MNKQIVYSKEQKIKMKEIIKKWFDDDIKPNCFVSIQFTKHLRREDLDSAYENLYDVLYQFYRDIYGRHWNRHIIPGIIFAEKGHATTNHFHIYFYDNNISVKAFQDYFALVSYKLRLPPEVIDVKEIETIDVYSYGAKELFIDVKGDFDPYRIIDTKLLFALYKRKSKKIPVSIKIIKEPHYELKDIPNTNWKKLDILCDYRKKQHVDNTNTSKCRHRQLKVYIPD